VSGLDQLRRLGPDDRTRVLYGCCASRAWAQAVAAELDGCATADDLHALSERVWWEQPPSEWRAALDAHPRIGDRTPEGSKEGREQGSMATAGPALREAIAEGNRAYERRFGMTYVVRAKGRNPAELLLLLRTRMDNDPETELRVAAEQQAEITRLRLADVLAGEDAA
jgi:OHCU decarboxylase